MPDQLPKYRCIPAAPVVMVSRIRCSLCFIRKSSSGFTFLSLIASVIAGYSAIPKRYSLGEHLVQPSLLWTDKEAFFFLTVNTMGQTDNFVLDKLGKARYKLLGVSPGVCSPVYGHADRRLPLAALRRTAATALTRANRELWRMGIAGRPGAIPTNEWRHQPAHRVPLERREISSRATAVECTNER